MTKDEAIECAKNMTYQEAIRNTLYAKGVRYKKATRIKLHELAEIADKLERNNSMTREEAIHELREWLKQMVQHGVPSHSAKRKALATAIVLLSAEPSGDLIIRADAIEVANKIVEELALSSIEWDDLKYWAKELFDALPSAETTGALDDAIAKYVADGYMLPPSVDNIPSADRPSGEWLYEESGWYGGDGYRCSVCEYGYSATAYHEPYEWHYCPNCGARMAERREE